jgi:hypothetical protein
MIRRLKGEVMSELPLKTRQQILLDIDVEHSKVLQTISKQLKTVKQQLHFGTSLCGIF